MPVKQQTPFALELDRRVGEGALGSLYEKLENNQVRCFACAHRCLIKEGLRGICKVRYNREGRLMVPHGYVGALQCDPIEKKPFFHAYPGSDALTFGMLGCDLHCSYCFSGDVRVLTSLGMLSFGEMWATSSEEGSDQTRRRPPSGLMATGADGTPQEIRWIFKHAYAGDLVRVVPQQLMPFEATPDHPVLATRDPSVGATFVPAGDLSTAHYLAVPRKHDLGRSATINVESILRPMLGTVRVGRHLPVEMATAIVQLTADGVSSAAIGAQLGLRSDYVRHVRSRLARRGGAVETAILTVPERLVVDEGLVRFGQERRPGIPISLNLTAELAELLGYYCAEGCIVKNPDRPNSNSVVFAFGLHERDLVERTRFLLKEVFGVAAYVTIRETTMAVSVGKSALGLLLGALCGSGSATKRVPAAVSDAERPVMEAFMEAFVRGDGHRYRNGKVSITTVSEELAWGVAALALRLGYLPGMYVAQRPAELVIFGRTVRLQPRQYTIVWREGVLGRTLHKRDDEYHYVPIRAVGRKAWSGDVFNLETAGSHTYLANFATVHNCQNHLTSQALRDPDALSEPMDCTAEQLVAAAERRGAQVVATSYNEPLITSEWAVEVFKQAKARNFATAYISNGNATREVLDFIRPWTDLYKIDLKSMRDKNYRSLGGKLENILNGIRMVHEMGFWLEIVTLLIPGFNDSEEELKDLTRFLADLSPSIPWHVTAFHKDYRMLDPDNTSAAMLLRAASIGEAAGLEFIYAGNLPGRVGRYEDTRCPSCSMTLIRRFGYRILEDHLSARGVCPRCERPIPGAFHPTRIELGRAK